MKHFTDCKTAEEVKALYKKLAMKLHPGIEAINAIEKSKWER